MAITWKAWRLRAPTDRTRRAVRSPGPWLQAVWLWGAAAVSVVLLFLAGYVADGYLVNAASVAVVVLLCAVAGWGVVEVLHGAAGRRTARRGGHGR